jgi:hypothetical protein
MSSAGHHWGRKLPANWQRVQNDAEESVDPDLTLVIENWAHLDDSLKQGIVAMVRAARGDEC